MSPMYTNHPKVVAHVQLGGRPCTHLHVAGAREVFSEFVEGGSHDTVRGVEGLLDAITVVNVNVNVKHALVVLEELQNGQHAVVDVAKSGGLALLSMVQAAGPVDDNV